VICVKGVLIIKKATLKFLLLICIAVLLVGCLKQDKNRQNKWDSQIPSNPNQSDEHSTPSESVKYINENGTTLFNRINTPVGFNRVLYPTNSLGEFIRQYPLKQDGAPVLLYNGSRKGNQNAHITVFDMKLSQKDLQQCADSVIKMYAEYFYANKEFDKIRFHFVNGFLCDYEKWRDGYRIKVNGNNVTWVKSASYNDSVETFENYLDTVFCYASTLSLRAESQDTALSEMQIGDIFINHGSPGHVVMVVDMCESQKGEKAFLLAQGYMPAQEFHILKNPSNDDNPWYYVSDINYPLNTPEYSFQSGSFKRIKYNQ